MQQRAGWCQRWWKLLLVMLMTAAPNQALQHRSRLTVPKTNCASPQVDWSEVPLDVRGFPEDTPVRDYVGAVYEFAAVPWSDAEPFSWTQNLDTARQQARVASAQGVDVLVFAEYAISGGIADYPGSREGILKFAEELPDLDQLANPCDQGPQDAVLATLSCMARDNNIYIVANIIEKQACDNSTSEDPCPADGFFMYNVDAVFDRNGTFIQMYRKCNMYLTETQVIHAPEPRLAAFRTDFGVLFGVMTCFDILWEVPGLELSKRGIRHVVYPTYWHDELPSFTGLQMHSSFARGLNITVMTSAHHKPSRMAVGSGIYSGGGILNYTHDFTTAEGKLVTARVPAAPPTLVQDSPVAENVIEIMSHRQGGSKLDEYDAGDSFYPVRHYNISGYSSALLTGGTQQLCHGEFCCQMTVAADSESITPTDGPAYRLVAYRGHRITEVAPRWGSEICIVVLCANSTQESCNVFPSPSSIQLPAFELSGTFSNETTVFPSVILQKVLPTTKWDYDISQRSLSVESMSDMMTAQLYGRNYAKDLPH